MKTSPHPPVLIAGAGLAGLAAARELAKASLPYELVEKEARVGGLCRTVEDRGFRFDYTGHFLHFKNAATRRWVESLPGLRLQERRRHAVIRSHGVYTEYPYQENSAGLPSEVARENVMGYLEAVLRERSRGASAPPPRSFGELCRRVFGEPITRHFMAPYNAKLLKTPVDRLSPSWMGRFIPPARIRAVVEGGLRARPSSAGYNATFLYPAGDGIEALPKALARGIPPARCGVSLARVDLRGKEALLSDGRTVSYRALLPSLSLPELCRRIVDLPASLRRLAEGLRATSVYNINLGLSGGPKVPYSWVYFPESDFVFHRAGCLSSCVRESAPPGGTSLYVEVSYQGKRPDTARLGRQVERSLRDLGWSRGKGKATRVDLDLPGAYVVYDRHRDKAVPALLEFLGRHAVHPIGRWGRWEYAGMDAALEQGREAAQRLI